MAEATPSHSMYRSGHFNCRHNYHSEYSQYSGGSRRSAPNGSFAVTRRHYNCVQQNHSRQVPEVVRETGLILEVHRDYGRILSQSNFLKPNIHIYFSMSTLVNDAPLSTITDSLADVFQVGATVEIEFERSLDLNDLRGRVHAILVCTSIKPTVEAGHEPELVPMIVIQDAADIPLALIANHELVALPRQVFPMEEIVSAFMTKKSEITADMEWPEFATVGRSIEGRILNAPPWMHECANPAIKKIALSLQRFGRDRDGFAVIKEYIGQGVVLTPIDEEDQRICGDLFFPYEMRSDTSRTECQDAYRIGSKWYFRACLELPNRKYKYRVYILDSLEDAVVDYSMLAQQRLPEQVAVVNEVTESNGASGIVLDQRTSNMALSNEGDPTESQRLIDIDSNEPLQDAAATPTSRSAAISSATLSLLRTVDFGARPAVTNGMSETVLLQSSPGPTCSEATVPSQSSLLVDFGDTDKVQPVTTLVRQFHIVDENFAVSSMNFENDGKGKSSYGAEICGCSDNEYGDDMSTSKQRQLGIVNLQRLSNGTSHSGSAKKEQVNSERNAIESTASAFKPVKCEKDYLEICERHTSAVPVGTNVVYAEEFDVSEDDSDNELFHAAAVERRDNSGWWFTRKFPDGYANGGRKMNVGITSTTEPSCSVVGDGPDIIKCYSKEDEPLLILTDDRCEFSENVSSASTPQCSLSTALQNDNVYAKFFSGLIRK